MNFTYVIHREWQIHALKVPIDAMSHCHCHISGHGHCSLVLVSGHIHDDGPAKNDTTCPMQCMGISQ